MFIEVPLFSETSPAPKNSWLRAWKYLCWGLFLIMLQVFRFTILLRRDSHVFSMNIVHMFFYEYCEIFKNAYFEENLWTAASE